MLFEKQLKQAFAEAKHCQHDEVYYYDKVLTKIAEEYNAKYSQCLIHEDITSQDVNVILALRDNLPNGFLFLFDAVSHLERYS